MWDSASFSRFTKAQDQDTEDEFIRCAKDTKLIANNLDE